MTFKKSHTKEEALQKLKYFCSYQERCHADVREKLYDLNVGKLYHDELISALIQDDYLNEERFAKMYAGGKFRINHWGKVKIKLQLKQKQVSDYCIKKALADIDESDYLETFEKHARKKLESLKGGNQYERASKISSYMLQKGFESQMIQEFVKENLNKKSGIK